MVGLIPWLVFTLAASLTSAWRIAPPSSPSPQVRCPQPWPRPTSHCTTAMRSSGDGVCSLRCPLASGSLTRSSQTARRSLGGHTRTQHLTPPRNTPVRTEDFAVPPIRTLARCIWWPQRMPCTSGIRHSSRQAVWRAHKPKAHCCHHCPGTSVPPPAFRSRACAVTPLMCVMPSVHSYAQAVGIAPTR